MPLLDACHHANDSCLLQEVADPLMDLKAGVEILRTSETFNRLISLLLAVGNFLNGIQVIQCFPGLFSHEYPIFLNAVCDVRYLPFVSCFDPFCCRWKECDELFEQAA